MADQIDLTRESDDDQRQSTFESDAALARKLSAELNGEAPSAQNNKRAIDLTADSQEGSAPPPAQRARTDAVSIKEMKQAIREAGLGVADLLEKSDVEARYAEALARLAERAERDAAAARARRVTLAPAPAAAPGSRVLSFVLKNSGGRLRTSWADGDVQPPDSGFVRHWLGRRVVQLQTHQSAPAVDTTVHLAYDSDGSRGSIWTRPSTVYRYAQSPYANGATLLKSLMQKAIRRQNADIAVRAAHELLSLRLSGGLPNMLKRLLVASCEDSAPLDEVNSVVAWFFASSCSDDGTFNYQPTEADVSFLLGAVSEVARCAGTPDGQPGWCLGPGPTKNPLKGEGFLADVPLADVSASSRRALPFLLVVAVGDFGPGSNDAKLLQKAALYYTTHAHVAATHLTPVPMASLARLRPHEWIFDCVDFHITASTGYKAGQTGALILDVMFDINPALARENRGRLKDWMMKKRSMVNARYNIPGARLDRPDWHSVADAAAQRIIAAAVVARPPW